MTKNMIYIIIGAVLLIGVVGFFLYFKSSSGSKPIITLEQASLVAQKEIEKKGSGMALFPEFETHDFGWVFFWNSKKYLETQDVKDMVPGTGPLVVTKGGKVEFLTSAMPPRQAIEEYKRTR